MGNKSRLEINVQRLLSRCESLASDAKNLQGNWRLEKYVEALEQMIVELKKSPSSPTPQTVAEYTKRVAFLKGLLKTEKLASASEKSLASQLLSAGPVSSNEKVVKEIQLQTQTRHHQQMREELLGKEDNEVRQRGPAGGDTSEDLDVVLKYHQAMQEKVAQDMVWLARSLKENSLLARHIIKKDTEVLESSTVLAEKNYSKLKVESSRLEQHVQRCCSWWIWITLAIVCCTFLSMVVFIKLFPKRL